MNKIITLAVIFVFSSLSLAKDCLPNRKVDVVHETFSLITLSDFKPSGLDQKIAKLIDENIDPKESLICESERVLKSPDSLAGFLTAIKYYFLKLRYLELNGNSVEVQSHFNLVADIQNKMIVSQETYVRRLAATLRSLIIDEVEKATSINRMNISVLDRLHLYPQIDALAKLQVSQRLVQIREQQSYFKSPQKIETLYLGKTFKKNWEDENRLTDFISPKEKYDTLSSQIYFLVQNGFNYDATETERFVTHYQKWVLEQLSKNPYQSISSLIGPLLQKEWKGLESDYSKGFTFLSELMGLNSRGQFEIEGRPIVLMRPQELKDLKGQIAKNPNGMGRWARYIILNEMVQLWTDIDVSQMQTDLNRVGLIRTADQIRLYVLKNKKAPKELSELKKWAGTRSGGLKDFDTMDYFSGAEVKYSKPLKRIWSVGENRKDEQGLGDDLHLTLSF